MGTELVAGSGLVPSTIAEAMELSEILAKSEIVPKDFMGKPSNIFVAVNWGIEIGLSPMQSLQSIAVINGRPSIWGDSALALVRGSGKLEYIKETQTEIEATCVVKRTGEAEVVSKFSMADAQRANLISRSPVWKSYPKRMMQMRARSFALRDTFTDVLKGIGIAEEMQDVVDTEVIEPVKDATPQVETKDIKKAILEEDVVEAQVEEVTVTIQTVLAYYKQNKGTPKGEKIEEAMMNNPTWRESNRSELVLLFEELKGL